MRCDKRTSIEIETYKRRMQFKKNNNKTIEMQCGHINQVGRIDLNELIQSANNKGLFVNVSIIICEAEWMATFSKAV